MPNPKIPLKPNLKPRLNQWIQDHIATAAKPVVTVDYTFGSIPNVEERVRHKLAQVPSGFRVVGQSAAGSVYRAADATANSRNHLHLKSSVAGLTVRLEVF